MVPEVVIVVGIVCVLCQPPSLCAIELVLFANCHRNGYGRIPPLAQILSKEISECLCSFQIGPKYSFPLKSRFKRNFCLFCEVMLTVYFGPLYKLETWLFCWKLELIIKLPYILRGFYNYLLLLLLLDLLYALLLIHRAQFDRVIKVLSWYSVTL